MPTITKFKPIKITIFFMGLLLAFETPIALSHGFNANRVQINRMLNGIYRVTIQYTHVEMGEYRESHVDFVKKAEAIAAYQKLVQGADFHLGDVSKTIHFHNPVPKNTPF